jgi:glycosyltransferase involved in cell wall biosynthesis
MIQENLILYIRSLADEELLGLQQSSGVHLCPSREEGFGHYINEARALGALVMTTNWAPMNDLVQDHFGVLISCQPTSISFYGHLPGSQACVVGQTELEQAMDKYFSLIGKKTNNETDTNENDDQLRLDKVRSMGEIARERFEDERDDFRDRMQNLFGKVLPKMTLAHQHVHNDDINNDIDEP